MKRNSREFRLALTALTLVALVLAVFGAVPAWAQGPVHNINTNEYFNTIQAAIDDADTLDGHTIEVAAGVYNENPITIDKGLAINGAQANVEPVDGGRTGGESVVNGTINIYADGVTVNGFEIPNRHDAIMGRNNRALHQNVQMLYNYIHSNVGGAVGINLVCDNPTVAVTTFKNYVISHNYINLSASNRAAIALNEKNPNTTKEYVYDGLEISYNNLTNTLGMAVWSAIDVATANFDINNPVIKHNYIHHCDRGIYLHNMHNADISNNEFELCRYSAAMIWIDCGTIADNIFRDTYPSPAPGPSYALVLFGTAYGAPTPSNNVDVIGNSFYYNNYVDAVKFENGALVHTDCDVSTIQFIHNNFYDGGANASALALKNVNAGTDLDAELNWWSDASGAYHPTRNPDGLGGEVSDDIDFEPWLLQEWPSTDTDETKTKEVDGSGTVNDADTAEGIGDIEIDATAGITRTITTAKYESNPGGDHTFVAEGYFDVHLDNIDNVASVTIDFCPATEDTVIYYWNGTDWLACSNQVFNPSTGCVVVTITAATDPDLDYLTGGLFASGYIGGTIVIEKQTDPADGTGFQFTNDIPGGPTPFTLDDGQGRTFNNVAVGTYTITETDPTATPGGYDLTNLTCVETGTNNSFGTVGTRTATINLEAGETITCTFTNTRGSTLTVNTSGMGTGTGRVTSDPAGIFCGDDCIRYYAKGTVVTLTAHPGVKSYFVGWSGDCSGTGLTTQVTMDADKTCTATFGYPVGGIVVPVDRLGLVAPWIGLGGLVSLASLGVALVRRRRG